jgi:hypothetical protein
MNYLVVRFTGESNNNSYKKLPNVGVVYSSKLEFRYSTAFSNNWTSMYLKDTFN